MPEMGFISYQRSAKFKNENVSYMIQLAIKKSKIRIEILTQSFKISLIYISL